MASKVGEAYRSGYAGRKTACHRGIGTSAADVAWRDGNRDRKAGRPSRYTNEECTQDRTDEKTTKLAISSRPPLTRRWSKAPRWTTSRKVQR